MWLKGFRVLGIQGFQECGAGLQAFRALDVVSGVRLLKLLIGPLMSRIGLERYIVL